MEVEAELNADFLHEMDEGDSKAATLEDGTRLGKVSKSRGRMIPRVADEKAFLTWVKSNYPSEITETVRESFKAKVFTSAKTHGAAVDEKTGEMIPGVELHQGDPFISFRGERGFQEVVAAKWSELIGPSLLEGGS